MSDAVDILMSSDQIQVIGPPAKINLKIDVGPQGNRGSKFWVGSGAPSALTLGADADVQENDAYLDTAAGWMYQYIMTPLNTLEWTKVYQFSALSLGNIGDVFLPETIDDGAVLTYIAAEGRWEPR